MAGRRTNVRTILTLVAIVAALILNAVVAAAASGADSARFEAESMTESSSAISVVSDPAGGGGKALRYTNDKGPADKTVTLVAPSERVVVRARATQGGGSPSVRLLVDGVDRGTKAVRIDSYADQVFDVPRLAPGSHTVVLRAVNATSNRALFADTVAFVAVETPPEITGVETTGIETTAPLPQETTPPPPPPNPCDTAKIVQPTTDLQSQVNAPGTYCLKGGDYVEADDLVNITAGDVTLRNVPGERAVIKGQIKTANAASNFKVIGTDVTEGVEGIQLRPTFGNVTTGASGDQNGTTVTHYTTQGNHVYGDNFLFSNIEIFGNNDALDDVWFPVSSPPPVPDEAPGVCMLITEGGDGEPASDGVIEYSDIHDCGEVPNENLTDPNPGSHALYNSYGLRTVIRHNLVYGNGARGIQIRNQNDAADVYGNIVDSNGNAVIFDDAGASNNSVHHNVLTGSTRSNGNVGYLSDTGPDNSYRDNCVWSPPAPAEGSYLGGNVVYSGNYNAPANPYGTFPAIADASCAAKLPADSPFRPASGG